MANLRLSDAPAAEWRSKFGRVEVHFEPKLGLLTVFLFPQAWTLEEAVSQAVHLREEMNRRLLGWEFREFRMLSSERFGALAMQWSGVRQNQESCCLEDEVARLKTLFPPE